MFYIIVLFFIQITLNLSKADCPPYCPELPFPRGNCGFFFRDRIKKFNLTEAELQFEDNKRQTKVENLPWTAALLKYDERIASIRCGATLISYKFVITSASCFFDEKTKNPNDIIDYTIILGTTNPMNTSEGLEKRIERLIIHPKYNYPEAYFDMALIELEGKELEFTMSPPIMPICLPSEIPDDRDKWKNRLIVVAGFGSEYGLTEMDDSSVQGYSFDYCTNQLFDNKNVKISPFQEKSQVSMPEKLLDNIACASTQSGNDGLCPGESGNTIGNEEHGRMILIGVAQGILMECSDRFPIIYTRTDHNETLPWIWREAFKENFEEFERNQYDRYGNQ